MRVLNVKGNPVDSPDAELLQRVKRLESLLAKQDAGNSPGEDGQGATDSTSPRTRRSSTPASTPEIASQAQPFIAPPPGSRLDEFYASFVKRQNLRPNHLSGEFWSTLGDEFQGLRKLLERRSDDAEHDDDELFAEDQQSKLLPGTLLLRDSGPAMDLVACQPSEEQRVALFDIYFNDVDPLCKLLHRPTASVFISRMEDLFDPITHRAKFASLEAWSFAIYFVAVTSVTDAECMEMLGEDRGTLLARYKRCTEIALTDANFTNCTDIVVLQALTLNIVSSVPPSSVEYIGQSYIR